MAARRALARLLPILAGAGLLSCNYGGGDNLPLRLEVPFIMLNRLGAQFHMRVFPRGDRVCDVQTGRIRRSGADAYDFAGGSIAPHLRCDPTAWAPLQSNRTFQDGSGRSVTSPVDDCFANGGMRSGVSVPSGSYLVLIEGSGPSMMTPGTQVLLGSGCAQVDAMPGQNVAVTITMQEQPERGSCGDMMRQADELCDTGGPTDDCNNLCRFPERTVNQSSAPSARHRRPSVAWQMGGRLGITFDAADDVYFRVLSDTGTLTGNALADSRDLSPASTTAFIQQNARIAALDTSFVVAWEDQNTASTGFNLNAVSMSANPTSATAPTFLPVNTMSRDMRSQTAVSMAANTSTVVFVYVDNGNLRAATSAAGALNPAEVAMPLVAASAMGGTGVTDPRVAATSSGFVVVWSATATDGTKDIFGLRLTAAGAPMGNPTVLNATVMGTQDQPSLAASGNDVLVAWRDDSRLDPQDNSDTTVRWRHFDASFAPDGMDRIAPTTTAGAQQNPTVSIGGGVALLAWEHPDGTIRGRIAGLDGSTRVARIDATTGDFQVNAAAAELPAMGMGPRSNPVAAYGGAGRFVVVWEDQGMKTVQLRTLVP